jgi:hypothetical protein
MLTPDAARGYAEARPDLLARIAVGRQGHLASGLALGRWLPGRAGRFPRASTSRTSGFARMLA